MLKHVVCFKLQDKTDEMLKKTADILKSMENKVELIRKIEVGCDFLGSPRSYDIILIVTLDDKNALEEYQTHPYHVDVVKKHMHAVSQSSIAVDYYIE